MGKREQSSPRHPAACGLPECDAPIWFRPVTSQSGGKPRLMPLDAEPSNDGNVAAHPDRDWEAGRIVQAGQPLRDGERLFHTHFETCKSPDAFRKRARPRPERAVREPGQPGQAALFPSLDDQLPLF